ncbi:U4/U6 small nuclear ribonucleoprotein PRP4-like protein [Heracleum sosnowskyi]|uniref:U4/U6 small nuclear ribonucleoprotein PRP4-like protein n=1 Tax=Heracleum sosnowskyi TaxID=360622 RepID=A0AAD8JJU1_9APIA|nr:U4/U6 small nuclear ribonucleoprotein PRP4-like protein [Heracleum sosnowskyi]
MDKDEDKAVSTAPTEPTPDGLTVAFAVPLIPVPVEVVQPAIPPLLPVPILPVIAPIPGVAPTIPRPLAPLPPRPPIPKPPQAQNGDIRGSDTDSDQDDSGAQRTTADYEISEESRLVRERQEKAMQDFLMKRRAAALAVPTNDLAVRARLRRLGEPMTLFGEREMERRDRLRTLMGKLDSEGELERLMRVHEEEEAAAAVSISDGAEDENVQYPFYTEGPKNLLEARKEIAKYSLVRASMRLQQAKRKRDDPDEDLDAEINCALEQAASLTLNCDEIGDDRPVLGCSFSHDGEMLATCALNGIAKVWSMPQVRRVCTLKAHAVHATDVAFSPINNTLATASADRTAKLWNSEGVLLRTFEGHLNRLARIAFHPSGKYLGTASFDKTWRLWDVETGEELLLQEGHSRSVYGLSFHKDGSLAASCGVDSLARVWDLRTGRSVLALEGHVKPIYGISFSPNGYHLATGGDDNTCRIWDLRKKKSLYTIPAHSKLISQVKFEPQDGYFLLTASHDMTAKVWSSRDFKPVKTLSGHEEKLASLDVVADGQYVATVSYDRHIKLWSCRDMEKAAGKGMDID